MADNNSFSLNPFIYNSIADFVQKSVGIPFRYWIYRRGYTPFEQEQKYMDESIYEDITCNIGYIVHCIILPDGDVLLGFLDKDAFDDPDPEFKNYIRFCKLSEIRLEWFEGDNEDDDG